MTQEEKAKAYDEAIKRAQAKMEEAKVFDYDDEQTAHTIRLTTTDIFPELAESEDERIRKEMISWLKGFIGEEEGCGYTEDEIRERIAWLEKQKGTEREIEGNSLCNGEQKPYGQREECLDCQMNYAGECKGSCAMKRDEQKPVNRLKTTAGNWYVCEMEVMNENMTTAFHSGEVYYCPKDGYIDVNGALFEVGTLDVFRLATKEEIPQPKQEWSEEDEKMYARIVRSYTSYEGRILYATNLSEDNRNNILEDLNEQELWLKYRLKTIRPQKQWKPSEEQMDALEDAIAYAVSSTQKNMLNSLYQDLQKLR